MLGTHTHTHTGVRTVCVCGFVQTTVFFPSCTWARTLRTCYILSLLFAVRTLQLPPMKTHPQGGAASSGTPRPRGPQTANTPRTQHQHHAAYSTGESTHIKVAVARVALFPPHISCVEKRDIISGHYPFRKFGMCKQSVTEKCN